MRGATGLALIFAIVFGMLAFTQVGALEASVTTLTGGFAEFFTTLPTLFLFGVVVVAVITLVGFLGQFFSR